MGNGSIGRELDLDPFVSDLQSQHGDVVNANFSNDAMVTVRLEKNGPAYTIYRTGTFQIRGAETEEDLAIAEKLFREALGDLDIEVDDYEFEHVTSVFMENLGQGVDLETATIALGLENTEYEPEQFSGLIYRPPSFRVTLLLFASGKIIVGGTTNRDQALNAVNHLREKIDFVE